MSKLTSENLCYLLWRERVERKDWVAQLAEWAECTQQRSKDLLRGAELLTKEQEQIAQKLGVPEEELQFKSLVEGTDILQENLLYLFDSLEHGEGKVLAERIGANPTTVSRWRSGEQTPRKHNLVALCHFFGLSSGTNLETDPIFLSVDPVGDRQRREWLKKRIDELKLADLQDLYPALERLFRD